MNLKFRRYLVGLLLIACSTVMAVPQPSDVVDTSYGKVQGLIERGTAQFKGIRYGAAPVGQQRFRPPQAPQPWAGVADAIGYGAPAMQMYSSPAAATDLSRQISTDQKIDNEDCLFLNVWTPSTDDANRPVLVWFHGGGYAYGSGHWPVYDGSNLAARGDVVVVTVNHRLNVFGYLQLGHLDEAFTNSGNAGMLDLVLALEWVRDNIASFGGNPANVTIMGESGGGAKVSTLMAMPSADGLFHKAIVQSGPGLTGVSMDVAKNTTRHILDALHIDENHVDRLLGLTADELLAGAQAAGVAVNGDRQAFSLAPVVDGKILPMDPFSPAAPEQSRDIPLMIGWNKDEFTIFNAGAPWFGRLTDEDLTAQARSVAGSKSEALLDAYRRLYPDYSPTYVFNMLIGDMRMFIGSVDMAERKQAQKAAPVYMYYLVWESPVGDGVFKSPHTLDMPLMFSNVDKSSAITGDGPEARVLEHQMASAWIAFARDGNPNNPALPDWPVYETVNLKFH